MKKINLIVIVFILGISLSGCSSTRIGFNLKAIEKHRVVYNANLFMNEEPETVTASFCNRSIGNLHDFYSEGDYWWPDEQNPNGPYIRKDGLTNPANFNSHREALIRLSQISGALASAYLVTNDEKYAARLALHLKARFSS